MGILVSRATSFTLLFLSFVSYPKLSFACMLQFSFLIRICKGSAMETNTPSTLPTLTEPQGIFPQLAALEGLPVSEVMDFIRNSKRECKAHKFVADITANDPFNELTMLNAIKSNVVNPFTNTPITNLGQACDHAAMECEHLRALDKVNKELLRKKKNAENQQAFRDRCKQDLAKIHPSIPDWEARIKTLIAKRNSYVLECNTEITELRARVAQAIADHNWSAK